ncbi:hypothetical protein HanPSC8_Chr10g0436781 [Helianthus annuus]|nr:hypothetical protein HanPSC8_Chr10g0436781 [Helianthus annuus]
MSDVNVHQPTCHIIKQVKNAIGVVCVCQSIYHTGCMIWLSCDVYDYFTLTYGPCNIGYEMVPLNS